jgi:hypothetical protein
MNEISQPDACVKSTAFGQFIRRRLFPVNKYDLLVNAPEALAKANDSAKAARESGFKFKSRDSGREFFVDAKYLIGDSSASVEWCQPFEFKKYLEMDNKMPVYILIGDGPQPASPQRVFMFPLKSIRFNRVLHSYIQKYKISTTRSVDEKELS